ncbi:glycerol-3-phosphate dehydrogenase [Novosphingobium bradum]|uniref:Glycerol-3-phosphate dehydrogenase n=1 Tax=Novosphingobium bradum TaxID=1737444 RepID=A0ABV7IQ75_9SPHN
MNPAPYDLLVIGGGINGVGVARDAAGRGLSVLLVERDDLAAHTSSASTKLIHGGLRYLEYYQFRLVRESLQERERLLAIAPHLIRPLRFVLPLARGGRPAWLLRLGLWLYDHLGGRISLPRSEAVGMDDPGLAGVLKPSFTRGFAYSDCRVDDARLVVANAVDAARRGATILTGVSATGARPVGDLWEVTLAANPSRPAPRSAVPATVQARAVVNAAGPWVEDVLGLVPAARRQGRVRLVKGSHILVARRWAGEQAYLFQNPDGRIVFAIPYRSDFTLIGTTDVVVGEDERASPQASPAEVAYLCEAASAFLAEPVSPADVLASWSGVRPLYDDGRAEAKAVTRDYVLQLGRMARPQVLSVFGGKLTTFRRLAEHALAKLAPWLPPMSGAWTASAPLPGGDLPGRDPEAFAATVAARWPFLDASTARRLADAYGTAVETVLGDARAMSDLGEQFGAGLTAREVDYLADHEWARTAQDILWRRTRLGLVLPASAAEAVEAYLGAR